MIFKRYFIECLAHASYLIADEGTRIAAICVGQGQVRRGENQKEREGA